MESLGSNSRHQGIPVKTLFLIAVLALLLIVNVQSCVNVRAAPAIVVLDHGFAKNFKSASNGNLILINRTSTFTQDDVRVYAFVQATFYSVNMTWNWYDPTGGLYQSSAWVAQCTASPCEEVTNLRISGTHAASHLGLWRLDFLDGGVLEYSDYFSLIGVISQYNYWDLTVLQSTTPRMHGSLRAVIHPSNGTWSYYSIYMPYAVNVTAFDYSTNNSLPVTVEAHGLVVVNLGGPRADGYSFVLKFDVSYILYALGPGNFAVTWREYPYERLNDVHVVPEEFIVNLPPGVTLLNVAGYNLMNLNYTARSSTGLSLYFNSNFTGQNLGWTVLYRSFSAPGGVSPSTVVAVNSSPLLPILPLNLSGLTLWSAVMSVFLLTASELVSPIYSRTGYGILINRKRLRVASLLLVALFIICVVYQFASQGPIVSR
jgi:hypothetical protein